MLRSELAEKEISELKLYSLAREVSVLVDYIEEMEGRGRLARIYRILTAELFHGTRQDRKLFKRRLIRAILKPFGIHKYRDLPSFEHSKLAIIAPNRFMRLAGSLNAWRQSAPWTSGAPGTENSVIWAQRVWQNFVSSRPDNAYLQSLRPHRGKSGPLRIIVLLGGGGLGDALLFSAFISGMKKMFSSCEITLMYEKNIANDIYGNNPEVDCVLTKNWGQLQDAFVSARHTSIFDLAVDVYCFLPRFLLCEESRIDMDRFGPILNANASVGHLTDAFSFNLGISILDRIYNVHVLDMWAGFSGLPLKASTPLVFAPNGLALEECSRLGLPAKFVTVRDGCNPGDLALAREHGSQRSTKQISPELWRKVLRTIRSTNVSIVQVGDLSDSLLPDVDVDLRGRTSLSLLAFVMKQSLMHIDTEGGLTHFARAVHTPAAVFFGTTSSTFFQYPGNIALHSDECTGCWYAEDAWVARCPRNTNGPVCGDAVDLDKLERGLARRVASRFGMELIGQYKAMLPSCPEQAIALMAEVVPSFSEVSGRSGLFARQVNEVHALASHFPVRESGRTGDGGGLVPLYNFPCNSGTLDWAVLVMDRETNAEFIETELRRMLKGGGIAVRGHIEDGGILVFRALRAT